MADFVTVARADEIPPGTVTTVRFGEEEIALAHVHGQFCAVQNACRHLGGPIGQGRLEGRVVTCPWHGWQYDVCTGLNEFDHAIRLQTYEVRVEGDEIQVRAS